MCQVCAYVCANVLGFMARLNSELYASVRHNGQYKSTRLSSLVQYITRVGTCTRGYTGATILSTSQAYNFVYNQQNEQSRYRGQLAISRRRIQKKGFPFNRERRSFKLMMP